MGLGPAASPKVWQAVGQPLAAALVLAHRRLQDPKYNAAVDLNAQPCESLQCMRCCRIPGVGRRAGCTLMTTVAEWTRPVSTLNSATGGVISKIPPATLPIFGAQVTAQLSQSGPSTCECDRSLRHEPQ